MLHYLANYALFAAKILTFIIALLLLFAGILSIAAKNKLAPKAELVVKKINDKFDDLENTLQESVLSKKQYKNYLKNHEKLHKEKEKEKTSAPQINQTNRKKIFVLNFVGDIKASAVECLREEVTAILSIALPTDEILVRLDSAGGMVHSYGLAASQLQRIKDHKIPLTVSIDKVAASGGYLMACVANVIMAAPFAIIGSIGVIAQLPNFNRWLKKNNIDFEQVTAGRYKRTLTVFGENTQESRQKMQESLEEVHFYFKEFIAQHRPQIDMEKVATGEHWLALKAFELNLVDKIMTSDDYLFHQHKNNQIDIFEVKYSQKQSFKNKLSQLLEERGGLKQKLQVEYR